MEDGKRGTTTDICSYYCLHTGLVGFLHFIQTTSQKTVGCRTMYGDCLCLGHTFPFRITQMDGVSQ